MNAYASLESVKILIDQLPITDKVRLLECKTFRFYTPKSLF
jgi:hypothetical protein